MEKVKNILIKLLFPPAVAVVLLTPVAAALLIYAFVCGKENSPVGYISYFLSAYALTVLCARSPILFRRVRELKQENRYIRLYLSDPHLRVKLSLYGSVTMNTLYGLMQLLSGFYFRSIWFYALAGYYALLAVMRYSLLKETRREKPGEDRRTEWQRYRFCGILLSVMNLILAVIVAYIVWQNRGFEYHSIHTIAMAAYTFTSMTVAIINVVRYRRYESPVMSAAKVISLASALVSMLSLETAMLTAFGQQNDPAFRRIMTASTGAAVCLLVLAIAVYMILHATRQIHLINKGADPL